jgi:purine-cytosine permease-like protein
VVVLYIGFFTSSAILGGEALARLLHVSTNWGIVICDAVTLVMASIGYDLIHRYDRWASVLFAAVFIAITVKMLTATRPAYHGHADTAATILLAISVLCPGRSPGRLTFRTTRVTCPRTPRPRARSPAPTLARRSAPAGS